MTDPLPVYEAIVNVPGYLPMADEPTTFDSANDGWDYLADQRDRDLDMVESPSLANAGEAEFMRLLATGERPDGFSADGCGTVFAASPGYEGDHDLGLAYTVVRHDHKLHCDAYPPAIANPSLPCYACELINARED